VDRSGDDEAVTACRVQAKAKTRRTGRIVRGRLRQPESVLAKNFGLVAAGACRKAKVCPLDWPVVHTPSKVGVLLDVDERICASAVLSAAPAAIGVVAGVQHGDNDRLVAESETKIVKSHGANGK